MDRLKLAYISGIVSADGTLERDLNRITITDKCLEYHKNVLFSRIVNFFHPEKRRKLKKLLNMYHPEA